MATKKITQLTAASAASLTQIFEIVNDPSGTPASQKLTLAQLITLVRVPDFTSALQTLTLSALAYSVNHGLGAVPRQVRCVFQCISTTGLFAVGDEVDLFSVVDTQLPAPLTLFATPTVVGVSLLNPIDNSNQLINQNGGGGQLAINTGFWKLKFYAWK